MFKSKHLTWALYLTAIAVAAVAVSCGAYAGPRANGHPASGASANRSRSADRNPTPRGRTD